MRKIKSFIPFVIILIAFLATGYTSIRVWEEKVFKPLKELTSLETVQDLQNETEAEQQELAECYVSYVVDGDTFSGIMGGEEIRVRLIGVDTPESVAPEEYLTRSGKENTEEGDEASEFTKGLITDTTVYLEFDEEYYDDYGRVLAYVYLEDGRMLQEILLEEGYAEVMSIEPNTKYKSRFEEIKKSSSR